MMLKQYICCIKEVKHVIKPILHDKCCLNNKINSNVYCVHLVPIFGYLVALGVEKIMEKSTNMLTQVHNVNKNVNLVHFMVRINAPKGYKTPDLSQKVYSICDIIT